MFDFVNKLKDKGRWRIFKLKLIDARLYFVSIFVGLLTGLVAVPYHYLLQFFFNLRHDFFDAHLKWYWYIPLFLLMWGILLFVSWLVKKMPLITGGGIPQTRGVINGRVDLILQTDKFIYIMEFKLNGTAEEALQQINNKRYALPFEADGRKLFKIGINFSEKTRNIEKWVVAS